MRASSHLLKQHCSSKRASGKKLLSNTVASVLGTTANGRALSSTIVSSSIKNNLFANKNNLYNKPNHSKRSFSTSLLSRNEESMEEEPIEREVMEYDVVIVGAGPSGLSCAIKLKQLAQESGSDISVCVLEKGQEVGSHLLSGACMETHSLEELFPNFRELDVPFYTPATKDRMLFLTEKRALPLPTISEMNNHGNYIVSLGQIAKWLSEQAEALGVDILPGFSADQVVYADENNDRVIGVITKDVGIGKDGKRKDNFEPGIMLQARQTIFSEGCRGSLTKTLYANQKFKLRENCTPQTFALGVKELWEFPEDHPTFDKGLITHSVGYPLDAHTYGGSFMYHFNADGANRVALGLVTALDYENPTLSPYNEFQKLKHHPEFKKVLEGGKCISYGARTLVEGGIQALPKLSFPGGVLIGDTAGFLNVPKIKGIHTAMKSGILGAESVFEALTKDQVEASTFQERFKSSWLYNELYKERNIRSYFKYGLYPGLLLAGVDSIVFRGKTPWTVKMETLDNEHTKPISEVKKIEYPKPDGVISFDLLTNLQRSGTNHNHDQPAHLKLKDDSIPVNVNLKVYGGPEQYFCPARVYEFIPDEQGNQKLKINAQNCLHCKACDIKDPKQNINWTVPEGTGGPSYLIM
ncbi:electron transfer flavoprotein-ubiquinone oxidoreductase [Naegleria gruberi]|uniref:Electron transfer flavoprotein-ubiquinone oxidoreductase n=1 Tax=Naegleria gruberi TaxID=5762 RepID=D2V9R8_NAEGR|nr:electron transfer flavoprotein-ubiquinone oxidoreductase [Naegleria gruberi]EFC46516.1 electron transfer flavoprotein-ubiquinone oxidoreductase [Naegleria gruberi]|eukprot:XP_002679260.1 electron transfer flavoprotein-ubiquinone oxidoreductase [Naegleria gruberi strain NEG-M]